MKFYLFLCLCIILVALLVILGVLSKKNKLPDWSVPFIVLLALFIMLIAGCTGLTLAFFC